MRKPTPRERRALRDFLSGYIENPGKFHGIGKKTWDDMTNEGWVVWVSSPETFEEGYMITKEGERVAYED